MPCLNNMQPRRRHHIFSHPHHDHPPIPFLHDDAQQAASPLLCKSSVSSLTPWASAHSLTRVNQGSRPAADIPDGVASRLETFRACRRPTAAATNQLPRPTSARQAPSHVPDDNAPLGRLRRCNLITLRPSAPQHCRGERLLGFERGDAHNRRTRPSTSKMPCLRPHGWWQQVP